MNVQSPNLELVNPTNQRQSSVYKGTGHSDKNPLWYVNFYKLIDSDGVTPYSVLGYN